MLCSGHFYLLHVETINLLLVLSSTQLYTTSPSSPVGTHPFIDALMRQQSLAAPVAQRALGHYCSRPVLPPKLQLWSPSPDASDKGVLRLVRSAAGQCMTHAHMTHAHVKASVQLAQPLMGSFRPDALSLHVYMYLINKGCICQVYLHSVLMS